MSIHSSSGAILRRVRRYLMALVCSWMLSPALVSGSSLLGLTEEFPPYNYSVDRVDKAGPWSLFLGEGDGFVRIVREIDIDHQFKMHASYYLSYSRCGSIMEMKPENWKECI